MTNEAMNMMSCSVDGQNIIGSFTTATSGSINTGASSGTTNAMYSYYDGGAVSTTLWGYWQNYYYPQIIRESYPVYIQEKAMDKGKQAFELVKALMDKDLIKVDKVKDFIEAMDTILKTL